MYYFNNIVLYTIEFYISKNTIVGLFSIATQHRLKTRFSDLTKQKIIIISTL
jgi:hypothetical protein